MVKEAKNRLNVPGHLTRASATEDVTSRLALPWILRLRYGLVAIEAAILAAAYFGLGAGHVLGPGLLVIAATASTNVFHRGLQLFLLGTRTTGTKRPVRSGIAFDKLIAGLFCFDILSLTGIFMLTGGASNPFSLLYLVQITLSATILSRRWTLALGAMAVLCFGSLFFFYVPLSALEPHHQQQDHDVHLVGMWVGFSFAACLIAIFSGKISEAFRQREAQLVSLERQLANKERLASLATLAAGAAHELSTPLATIAVVAKELERMSSASERHGAIAEDSRLIRSEVERCRRILNGMSAQGAELPGEFPRLLSGEELARQVLETLPAETRRRVQLACHGPAPIKVPVLGLVQSLSALLKNAAEASPEGIITLRIDAERSVSHFKVIDNGCGMPREILERIGEPFFTTKPAGQGMGLGVFLVRAMAEQWGGRLTFQSARGSGTVAALELPLPTEAT